MHPTDGTTPDGTTPRHHTAAPHRTAPHRTAPHRTAPHRTAAASHRTATHRTAPHRMASHRTASLGMCARLQGRKKEANAPTSTPTSIPPGLALPHDCQSDDHPSSEMMTITECHPSLRQRGVLSGWWSMKCAESQSENDIFKRSSDGDHSPFTDPLATTTSNRPSPPPLPPPPPPPFPPTR